jgi:multiple sugar transport system substrate-binding protein
MFFSIASNSKHKEEAAKFINFFVNDVEANKLIKGDRGVPVAGKVKEALKPLLPPELQKVFDYITWAEQNSSPADPPDPIGAAEVMALFKTYDEQMKFEQITPEEAAKRFRQEANEILGRNR